MRRRRQKPHLSHKANKRKNMSVLLVRIDDRLVHGQVVKGWVKHLQATQVTVVADSLVDNSARRAVMELALPPGVKLQVVTTARIAERGDLVQAEDGEREIILFASPADVFQAIKEGLQLAELNLGGVHHFNGNRCLTPNIVLSRQDVSDLKQLLGLGIGIKVCALPKDKAIDLDELL